MGKWYKNFYASSPDNEKRIIAALTTDPEAAQNMADVQKRLDELNKIPEERCVISSEQRRFLTRVLAQVKVS